MINDQLLSYVKQQLAKNVPKEIIANNLKSQGWTDADVGEAFRAITPSISATPAPAPVAPMASGSVPNISPMQAPMTQPVANFSNPKPHKSKKALLFSSILLLLVLAGGGAYAYYSGAFVTLPGLLEGYQERAQELKSFKLDMHMGIDFSEMKSLTNQFKTMSFLDADDTKLNLRLLTSYDVTDRNNMKFSSVISAAIGALSLEAEMRALDGTAYVQVTKFPALPIPMLEIYRNKWFSAPFESINNENYVNEFTTEERDYLDKMFQNAHILTTFKKLAPETIAGESSYHFSFDLDREALVSYMESYKDYIESIKKTDSRLSDFKLESFKKALEQVKDFSGEVWIGRNDKLISKIAVNFGITPDDGVKDEQVKISFTAVASDDNQPVSVIAPAESTSFQSLISGMMTGSIDESRQKGKDASIKANMSNLRAWAELFWDKNNGNGYSGFCLSKELKDARKSIEDSGSTGFVCKDSVKAYAVSTKLVTVNYWCVDSTGVSGETAISSGANTVCPKIVLKSDANSVALPSVPF